MAVASAICVVPCSAKANVSDSIKQQQGGTSQSVGIQTHQTSIGVAEQYMTTPQYVNKESSVVQVVIPQKEVETGAETGTTETTSQGLTPSGNFTIVDDIVETENTESSDSTEFMTVVTKGGNYLYLVVDKKNEKENVHLLNMVDESDLIALINDEPVAYDPQEKVEVVPSEEIEDETEKDEVAESETSENSSYIRLLIGAVLLGGLGYFAYKKLGNRTDEKELDEYFKSNFDESENLSEEDLDSMMGD